MSLRKHGKGMWATLWTVYFKGSFETAVLNITTIKPTIPVEYSSVGVGVVGQGGLSHSSDLSSLGAAL